MFTFFVKEEKGFYLSKYWGGRLDICWLSTNIGIASVDLRDTGDIIKRKIHLSKLIRVSITLNYNLLNMCVSEGSWIIQLFLSSQNKSSLENSYLLIKSKLICAIIRFYDWYIISVLHMHLL